MPKLKEKKIDSSKDTVSMELCYQLKEAGVVIGSAKREKHGTEVVERPTTGELLLFMPAHLNSGYSFSLMKSHYGVYYAAYRRKRGKVYRPEKPGEKPPKLKKRLTSHRYDSPADALASLLVWLVRNGWYDKARWENEPGVELDKK